MCKSKPRRSLNLDEYLAALLADDGPGSTALAAQVLRLGFEEPKDQRRIDEPRDQRGRWTAGGPYAQAAAAEPPKPVASKEAKELLDLLRKSGPLRDYLEELAKASTKVERGGFILVRTKGTDGPQYKIVEEIPKSPKPNAIHLMAWPRKAGDKWDGALFPTCPPFGSIDMAKLPPKLQSDPNYRVRFWWHTHITGWVTDSKGLPMTGEPLPSGDDLTDPGVVGLMVKFDEVTKKLRIFIIERNGKFFEIDPKTISGTPQPKAN